MERRGWERKSDTMQTRIRDRVCVCATVRIAYALDKEERKKKKTKKAERESSLIDFAHYRKPYLFYKCHQILRILMSTNADELHAYSISSDTYPLWIHLPTPCA